MRSVSLLALFFLFATCKKDPALFEINNLNGNDITILGHRGMGELYKFPGNTYEAIEPLIRIGGEGSEVDVQMTKDSVLVLYHDSYLDSDTDCGGIIHNHLWSEIGGCTYSRISKHIYMITADNLFSRIPDLQNYRFSFDCKVGYFNGNQQEYYDQFARAIKRLITKHGMENRIFIEGTKTFLQTMQDQQVPARLFITGLGSIAGGIPVAEEMNLYGLATGNPSATKEDIDLAHAKGFRVMLWAAKTQNGSLKAVEKSPDYIQADKPIYLLKLLGKYKK